MKRKRLSRSVQLKPVTNGQKQRKNGGVNFQQDIPDVVVVNPVHKKSTVFSRKLTQWPLSNELSLVADSQSLYVQLNELDGTGLFWKETARWIRYEENVEPSGNWGRPFLSYIEAESLRMFKDSLTNGLVLLGSVNEGAYNLSHIISSMFVLGGHVDEKHRARLQQMLCLPNMHQGESNARFVKKVELRRKFLTLASSKRRERMEHAWELSEYDDVRNRWVDLARKALNRYGKRRGTKVRWENLLIEDRCPIGDLFQEHANYLHAGTGLENGASKCSSDEDIPNDSFFINIDGDDPDYHLLPKTKEQIKLKKIVHFKCNGILILHAPVGFLKRDKILSALIRFKNINPIADSLELSLPVRFVYILITSKHSISSDGHQVCRAAATLFKDKTFLRYAMRAKSVDDLADAANKFIDGSVMLPPGNWKPELLIPIAGAISNISRKKHVMRKFKHRDGRDLWRIVRTKLVVISMMKELLQNKEIEKSESSFNKEVNEEKESPSIFPRRRDCDFRTTVKRRGNTGEDSIDHDVFVNNGNVDSFCVDNLDESEEIKVSDHPLTSNGRWFGGLEREIRTRYPHYWTDIKEAFHIQCFASLIYLAISLTAMCLTYGQVISKYTNGNLGPSEMLSATCISCILMALFGTEPLTVIAGTAAMLIFESSSYQVSELLELDFFQFRFFTGIWIFIFLVLILAFDKTHWIHYCTRFTEEILHVLIALLFMYEGIKNLMRIFDKHPLREEYIFKVNVNSTVPQEFHQKPNTALLYTIFMFITLGIALGFRLFEKTRFFSSRTRRLLNFFSIPVAVNVMNVITYFSSVYLNTITVPTLFQSTSEKRSRVILPDQDKISAGILSFWIIPLAAIPALLTVILLFIESEVTLLECFKQTRGRKGSGFHTNLFIVAIMVLVSSFLGLPWMCLAAVETSVHLDSLKVWSSFDAPGVKSHVVKIREQRLTLLFTGVLVGLSVFLNSYLNHIPEAVFSGMVLYMGVVALFGVQLVERFFLMFMAPGQHPDIPYLKNVPLFKVYSFTLIQILCVVVLWVVKSFKIIAPSFPLFVLLMIPLRALLGKIFTEQQINQLDNANDEEGHGPLD